MKDSNWLTPTSLNEYLGLAGKTCVIPLAFVTFQEYNVFSFNDAMVLIFAAAAGFSRLKGKSNTPNSCNPGVAVLYFRLSNDVVSTVSGADPICGSCVQALRSLYVPIVPPVMVAYDNFPPADNTKSYILSSLSY